MDDRADRRRRWVLAGVIAIDVLAVVGFCIIFLVLTGIIAEPETVIEGIIRELFGR